jgi:hypothetical protein
LMFEAVNSSKRVSGRSKFRKSILLALHRTRTSEFSMVWSASTH